ncbi:MAG: acyltransferase [Candidatus Methanomethylicaceae archaeon]
MFISNRANILGMIEGDANIFGPSYVGSMSLIGDNVTIGYPVRKKILSLEKRDFESYDSVSAGSRIGESCIIRSNTIIYEEAELGDKVEIGHGALIREKTIVGEGTRIGTHSVIDGNVKIGKNNNIQTGVYLPPGTVIGSDVFLGPYVTVTNDRYPPTPKISGVTVEDGAVVGCRAVLIAGVRIGERAIVAAGAVVTKDVDPETVVLGVPARIIMSREDYDRKQKEFLESI